MVQPRRTCRLRYPPAADRPWRDRSVLSPIFQSCHNAPSCLSRPRRSKRLWASLVPVPAVVYRDDPAAQGAQRPTMRCCYRLTDSIMSATIH